MNGNESKCDKNKKRIYDDVFVFVSILFAAIAIRVPVWWNSAIDIDEGMFALMGREVSRGNLPYTTLFDIKPLGIWIITALGNILIGNNLFSVRIIGLLSVSFTSFCTYKISMNATRSTRYSVAAPIIYLAFTTQLTGLLHILRLYLRHSQYLVF